MRKSADVRKSEIMASVMVLADRIGPDRVTTAAVAAEVGVTQAALFRHFPTKAALWTAVAEDVSRNLAEAWVQACEGRADPVQRLEALVAAQFGQIAARPAIPMLLFSRELSVDNEDLRMAFRDRLAAFHALLEQEIGAAQGLGLLRPDITSRDAALLMTSLIQGVAIRWTLGARAFSITGEGARLFRIYLHLLSVAEC